jgi:type I restriction enzyme M protein
LLNTSMFALGLEVNGRVNLGEGALKIQGFELESTEIANPQYLDNAEKIIAAFYTLMNRPVKSIFEEVKMKDRQKLDSLVLDAIGLDPAKYLQPIYDGLTELVRERMELAGMRQKLKKDRPVRDIAKMTEQVMNDLIQEGIKSFPDDFLHQKLKPQECSSVAVPDVPLRLGDYFLGQQEVAGDGFSYQASSVAAAKYIIYAHKPSEYIVSLPNDQIIITKAITDYENYLKELFQKLSQELLNRTFDHKQAETLSRRIFQELGLPSNSL